MNQRPDARLTPDIAQQLCIRTGSTAVLNGSIAKLAISTCWVEGYTVRRAIRWSRSK